MQGHDTEFIGRDAAVWPKANALKASFLHCSVLGQLAEPRNAVDAAACAPIETSGWARRWSHAASTGAHAGTLPPCPNALAFSRLIVRRSVHSSPDGAVHFARARSGLPLRTTATRVRAAVATGQRQAARRALRRGTAADDVTARADRV